MGDWVIHFTYWEQQRGKSLATDLEPRWAGGTRQSAVGKRELQTCTIMQCTVLISSHVIQNMKVKPVILNNTDVTNTEYLEYSQKNYSAVPLSAQMIKRQVYLIHMYQQSICFLQPNHALPLKHIQNLRHSLLYVKAMILPYLLFLHKLLAW